MDPEPRFAWNGDSTVAYEVVGEGPVGLVYMPGFINNLEVVWDNPLIARFLKRLASFSRLIIVYASSIVGLDPSADVGWDEEQWRTFIHDVRTRWGSSEFCEGIARAVEPFAGRRRRDGGLVGAVPAAERDPHDADRGRGELHGAGRTADPAGHRRVERFVRDVRTEETAVDRVLATVLFTDIVDSTAQAAALGDAGWREVRERHDRVVRDSSAASAVSRSRRWGTGSWRRSTVRPGGSGALGPSPTRCRRSGSRSVVGSTRVRSSSMGPMSRGSLSPIGARVGALAEPSEVLVSQTVRDLVVGSGLVFEDRGEHELKGVPDRWHLYRVVT